MNVKKIILIAVVALLLFYLISEPQQAANFANTILGALKDGATAVVQFLKSLFG